MTIPVTEGFHILLHFIFTSPPLGGTDIYIILQMQKTRLRKVAFLKLITQAIIAGLEPIFKVF